MWSYGDIFFVVQQRENQRAVKFARFLRSIYAQLPDVRASRWQAEMIPYLSPITVRP